MMIVFLLCAVVLGVTEGNNVKKNLMPVPRSVPYYNEVAVLGRWFVQCRVAGCNYESSDNIKDYTQFLTQGKNGRISYETWRNEGLCNTLSSRRIRQKMPGVYTNKDPIGSVWSGTVVVVSIDYKRYKILWGCSKMSVRGDMCDDPYLNVYTRMPKPDHKTMAMIDGSLRKIFGISVASLPRIAHGMPCPEYGVGMNGGGMKKG